MALYKYKPFPRDGMIRIVKLLPLHSERNDDPERQPDQPGGSAKYDIQCRLQEASLSENPRYEALSYTWGDPNSTVRIGCGDAVLDVTTNLYAALLRLRKFDESVFIWIDAICINQGDTAERNSQVRMMRQIYQNATSVRVWIGEEDETTKLAFDFIPRLIRGAAMQMQANDTRQAGIMPAADFQRYYGKSPSRRYSWPTDDSVLAFLALTSRPWFRRVWIIQEVSLAKDAVLICGSHQTEWTTFAAAIRSSIQVGLNVMFDPPLERVLRMDLSRDEVASSHGQDLERLIFRYRDFDSTNPRDKVYGLLGLSDASNLDRLDVKVDYDQSKSDLFRNLATATLRANQNLDILGACCHAATQDSVSSLPSWVPDWEICEIRLPLLLQGYPQEQDLQWAATNSSAYTPKFSDDGGLLHLEGHILTHITKVGAALPVPPKYIEDVNKIMALAARRTFLVTKGISNWQATVSLLKRHQDKYLNGELLRDAFWQTLLAGHYEPSEFEAAKSDYERLWKKSGPSNALLNISLIVFSPLILVFLVLAIIPYIIFQLIYVSRNGHPYDMRTKSLDHTVGFMKRAVHLNSGGWALAVTDRGYLALAPDGVQVGDKIGLFKGGKVPLVIRQNGSSWELLGECYVHGVMRGEGFEEEKCVTFQIC